VWVVFDLSKGNPMITLILRMLVILYLVGGVRSAMAQELCAALDASVKLVTVTPCTEVATLRRNIFPRDAASFMLTPDWHIRYEEKSTLGVITLARTGEAMKTASALTHVLPPRAVSATVHLKLDKERITVARISFDTRTNIQMGSLMLLYVICALLCGALVNNRHSLSGMTVVFATCAFLPHLILQNDAQALIVGITANLLYTWRTLRAIGRGAPDVGTGHVLYVFALLALGIGQYTASLLLTPKPWERSVEWLIFLFIAYLLEIGVQRFYLQRPPPGWTT
jgi:hypothetical protein